MPSECANRLAARHRLKSLSWLVATTVAASSTVGCVRQPVETPTGGGASTETLIDTTPDATAPVGTSLDEPTSGEGATPGHDRTPSPRAGGRPALAIDTDELDRRREAARAALRQRHEEALRNPPPRGGEPGLAVGAPRHPPAENEVARVVPAILDFGDMEPGGSQERVFRVENISDEPIVVSRLIMSGGGHPRPPKDPIAPGESVEIPVTFWPGPRQGVTHNKRLAVVIAGHPPIVLTLHGRVRKHIDIQPELLNLDPDNPDSGRIAIASVDGDPFHVLSADPPILRKIPSTASAEHVLEVDAKLWQRFGRPVRVSIGVDHPALQNISVMIRPRRMPE